MTANYAKAFAMIDKSEEKENNCPIYSDGTPFCSYGQYGGRYTAFNTNQNVATLKLQQNLPGCNIIYTRTTNFLKKSFLLYVCIWFF